MFAYKTPPSLVNVCITQYVFNVNYIYGTGAFIEGYCIHSYMYLYTYTMKIYMPTDM